MSFEGTHDEPEALPGLMEMFINSTDTLRHRPINQKIPETWNDRPPLFEITVPSRSRPYLWRKPKEDHVTEREDPNLLKGMIRTGIPPSLRCAVWLSNIIQSSHPQQELSVSHEFRTLAKVRVVEGLYDSMWMNVENSSNKDSQTPDSATIRKIHRQDVRRIDFGNTTIWTKLDEEQCAGRDAVERVLYALHYCVVGGIVDYAPLLPSLATVLLGFMSESYVFYACREMYYNSAWYFPTCRSEHVATKRAFLDVLERLHPQTYATMHEQEATGQFTDAIFQDFFASIFPEWMVFRLMDMYTLEGIKVLFRFGVALAVLYGKEYKEHYMYASMERNKYWLGLVDFCLSSQDDNNTGLNFQVLVKKAYGVHGRGVRKRFRFPRRPILTRIIEMEEEAYRKEQMQLAYAADSKDGNSHENDIYRDFYFQRIEPLGFVIPPLPADPRDERIVARFGASTLVRTKLAEWLPLSLRFTKLELIYSTSHHGRTLESLYRHVSKVRHTILILEPFNDTHNDQKILMGMYASHPWHPSTRVYGDGRCILFRIVLDDNDGTVDGRSKDEKSLTVGGESKHPESKCWKWQPPDLLEFGPASSDDYVDMDSSKKSYASAQAAMETFQISTNAFLSMGGNEHGGAGLRLNEDLTKAESSTAAGFNNEPLLPGGGGMFEVGLVEIYQLVRQMDGIPVQ